MASGSGWNLWVWLAGGGCGWNLWVYRFPHIIIPTPLVSVLFCSFKKMFFVLYT